MHTHINKVLVLASAMTLASCVSLPTGPSSMALPGTGKNFNQFRIDDASCRQFAHDQVGGATSNQASTDSFAESAILGTVLGTLVGAAVGGDEGAGVGAATGLFVGSVAGANAANVSGYSTQHRYDNAYTQCMYAQGHRVPVSGHIEQRRAYRAPANTNYPPPPPPPPGYIAPR